MKQNNEDILVILNSDGVLCDAGDPGFDTPENRQYAIRTVNRMKPGAKVIRYVAVEVVACGELRTREKLMACLSKHHQELDANGVGKCSVPMWCNGIPAGFCDNEAYGIQVKCETFRNNAGELMRLDGKYAGYIPALACPAHGGPEKKK